MTRIKKWSGLILFTMLLFCCALFGCNEAEKPPKITKITLNYNDYALGIFETVQLEIVSAPEGEPEWTSENPEIVSVNETGLVEAVSQGTANVVVSIGSVSASCEVTVIENGSVPTILLNGIEEIGLMLGDSYMLTPSVSYNGQVYDDGSFTYETVDNSIAKVDENGKVTALALGETNLIIKANWRNYVNSHYLVKSIPVKVNHDAFVKINEQSVVLYSYEMTKNGVTYLGETQLGYTAEDEGKTIDSTYLTWKSSNSEVVTVEENGMITAGKIGTANVTLVYENDGKYCESGPCTIEVQKPVVDYTKKRPILIDAWVDTQTFSVGKTESTYDLKTLFAENREVTGVTNVTTGETVSYTDGKFTPSELVVGEYVWQIENENYTVKTNVIVATKVITTAQELMDIQSYGGISFVEHDSNTETRKWYTYGGYFALGNDITFTASDYADGKKFSSVYYHMTSVQQKEVGFTGVFNGLGYRIYDVSVSTGGLFGNVAKEGLIKNLNIHNAKLNDSWGGVLAHSISGNVENCSIIANANNKQQVSALCFLFYDGKLKDIHVMTSGLYSNSKSDQNSAVVYWSKGSACKVENVSVNDTSTGVLVGSDQAKISSYITVREVDNIVEDAIIKDLIWTIL